MYIKRKRGGAQAARPDIKDIKGVSIKSINFNQTKGVSIKSINFNQIKGVLIKSINFNQIKGFSIKSINFNKIKGVSIKPINKTKRRNKRRNNKLIETGRCRRAQPKAIHKFR